ncbi:hypothetical protein [Clostridium magnum]|uniref:Uncharacterized protein n=1 Tax=Clostridium magnum DSM 2767 TaxID=1121326 RepID=A0A162UDX0_9CLOT|nr:hypothetical protein [Clostridium magnum]KZL93795.1 hypothetical protein CLMAG_08460 [Clostridium magnum DSM 2767]SHI08762.1 hypothetical protein SAMN02745944_02402 [Clostridium magnum DSM 2767]
MQIDLEPFLGNCSCGRTHAISVQGIYIEPKASRYLSELLELYKFPVFICDSNIKKVTEEILGEYFQ